MSQARILTDKEYRKVLLHIARKNHHARNKLLINLSHAAGMRVGEIASLTIKHVLAEDGTIKDEFFLSKNETKGNKGRTVLLSQKLRDEIHEYLTVRFQLKDLAILNYTNLNRPLIYSQKSETGFSANSLAQWFGLTYRAAGLHGCSSHSGRRKFATTLSQNAVNPKIIQKLLGHRQIQTTFLYVQVSPTSLRKAVELL
jgi:integrase/recombinase XerD